MLDLAPRLHSPCMVVIRRDARIAEDAKRNAEEMLSCLHPCPPPRQPPPTIQTSVRQEWEQSHPGPVRPLWLRELESPATATAHSHAPPAASVSSAASPPSGPPTTGTCAVQFQSCVSDDWNNAAVTQKEVKRKRLNLSPCKKDLGGWSCSLFSREVYPTTIVAQLAARRRGLTRTGSCSLARYNKQATSVVLCTREV